MSFLRYREATARMHERYLDASAEELDATGDRTCIICREQMVHGGETGGERTRPKKLRCGHILHFHCLRSWLERQQTCPLWYMSPLSYFEF
jgi:E3 ubiquitin-protein ligase synoviolin